MKLWDKIRDVATSRGFYRDNEELDEESGFDEICDDSDDIVTGYQTERNEYQERPRERMTLPPLRPRSDAYRSRADGEPKVVNLRETAHVIIAHPKTIEEAATICDNLLENRIVIINFESVDHGISQRIVDFLGGAAYSLRGHIQSTGNRTFIIAPKSVSISGQLKEELEAGGFLYQYKAAAAR